MTGDRLAELEALANAATKGPWEVMPDGRTVCAHVVWHDPGSVTYTTVAEVHYDLPIGEATAVAEFSARARTAAPELIAEVRRLRAENGRLDTLADNLANALAESNATAAAVHAELAQLRATKP